jgi:hypothetical protein
VNVTALVEMLNVSPVSTRVSSLGQVSDQSPQTFNESLLAASKPPGVGAANQRGLGTGYTQKPVSQDEMPPRSMSHVATAQSLASPQKTVQKQVQVTQQMPLINPALLLMQHPLQKLVGSAGVPIVADGHVAKSDSVSSNHAQKENNSPQATSVLTQAPQVSPTATNPSNELGNSVLNTASTTLSAPVYTDASVSATAAPGVLPDAVQEAVSSSVSTAVPGAVLGVTPTALPVVVLSTVPIADSSVDSSPVTSSVPGGASSAIPKPFADALSSTVPTALPDALPSAVQNLASALSPTAIPAASSKAAPAPVLHDAVNPPARGAVAPKSSSVSSSQAETPTVKPDPGGLATILGGPGATVDQLVALIPPAGGLLTDAQDIASSVQPATVGKASATAAANGKDGAGNAISDATELKQHSPAASEVTVSQTGSQATAQSGDQSQGDASQQGQSAAPAQVNLANHTLAAVDHGQTAGVAAPLQTAPTPPGITAHTTKTPDIAAPATIAPQQSVPIINTAKLIQSMGQSGMQVGMRSNDFGNISISTSATRDLVSAQISLDHAELARTLATHLPEMQARLGGDQAMNVRIDMNGQTTGQGAGTSSGMSNGSPEGSRGNPQQKGSTTSSQSPDGSAGWGSSIAAPGMPSGEVGLDARLDIRV